MKRLSAKAFLLGFALLVGCGRSRDVVPEPASRSAVTATKSSQESADQIRSASSTIGQPLQSECSEGQARQALTEQGTVKNWPDVYRSFQRFSSCDDGDIAEGYSDAIEQLFLNHWDSFDQFAMFAKSDEQFRIFVLRHINVLFSANNSPSIIGNARDRCPPSGTDLCQMIIARMISASSPKGGVENLPGTLWSPNGGCQAELRTNTRGGANDLLLAKPHTRLVHRDVNGMAWISDTELVFTGSPVYGAPGIYVLNCMTGESGRIVAPRTINAAYPDGADYFELYWVSDEAPATLFFYYADDVDNVNFVSFRTPANLFVVRSDGNGFRKASNTDKLPIN